MSVCFFVFVFPLFCFAKHTLIHSKSFNLFFYEFPQRHSPNLIPPNLSSFLFYSILQNTDEVFLVALFVFFLLTLKNSSLTYHFFHLTLLKSTAMKTYIKYISCWQLMSSCLVDRVKRPVLLSRDSDTQEYCLLSPLL